MSIATPTVTIRSKAGEEAPLISSSAYSGSTPHISTTYYVKLGGSLIWN